MNTRIPARPLLLLTAAVLFGGPTAAAQSVTGRGSAVVVSTPLVQRQLASSTLPTYGGLASASEGSTGVPGLVDAAGLNSISTGMLDVATSSAQTTAEAGAVRLLNGLITADQVVAVASSYVTGTAAASDATGSGLVGLVVAGQRIAATPAPNTRIALPGVGYVVLNEQVVSGDGASTSGITVNMLHVVLQNALTGLKTGEIILGSASSAVTR